MADRVCWETGSIPASCRTRSYRGFMRLSRRDRQHASETLAALLRRRGRGVDGRHSSGAADAAPHRGGSGGAGGGDGERRRDRDASVPSGCSTIGRWMNHLDVCPSAGEGPGDNRVRVPHFARVELVTAPNGRRYHWQQREDSSGDLDVVGDPDRPPDRLIDVGNLAFSPTPNLVAEDSESAEPPRSNWTYRYNTAPFAMQIRNRRLLNHEAPFRSRDDEGRMVEITPRTAGNESRRGFEELPADPNGVRPSAQRDPIQVDGRLASDRRFRPAHRLRVVHKSPNIPNPALRS